MHEQTHPVSGGASTTHGLVSASWELLAEGWQEHSSPPMYQATCILENRQCELQLGLLP